MLLTEKSHELCDIMDILLVNNEMLIRGRVALLGNSVSGSVRRISAGGFLVSYYVLYSWILCGHFWPDFSLGVLSLFVL